MAKQTEEKVAKKIKMLQISLIGGNGDSFVTPPDEEIFDGITEAEVGDSFVVRVIEMAPDEIDNLPDFDRF